MADDEATKIIAFRPLDPHRLRERGVTESPLEATSASAGEPLSTVVIPHVGEQPWASTIHDLLAGATKRKSACLVTLRHPFRLPGMEQPHPGGTFRLDVEDVVLDLPWQAYRTRLSVILPIAGGVEAWPVTADELINVLATDRDFDIDTGHS